MARSYNVSFNITGNESGLVAALKAAANAMKGLGNAARAASASAKASQAGLRGIAASLDSLQNAANKFKTLQEALKQTTADFGRSGAALEAAKAKMLADAQAADQLRQKLADLNKDLGKARAAKVGEQAGLKTLRQQMQELKQAYAEAKRAGDTLKTTQLKSQISALGAAIQAQQDKVRAAANAYKDLSDKARVMKAELKAAEQAATASGQGLNQARQNAERLRQTYQQQLSALNQLKAALTSAGFDTSNFASSESRLAADINRVNAALERQAALQNAQRNSAQASHDMFNAYNNFQGALQTAGQIASPFKSAIDTAITFEHAMSRVKALTQSQNIREGNTEIVAREMQALTEQARELGATTSFTATQAAQAMGYLGMAGWKTQQILGTMPGMLDLAAAAGSDLAQTADIVSDNMTAMGVPVEQASHFMDVYAYALTNSNARLSDFGETMKYAAPVAKAYGSTLDETAAMVMMMANAGIKGSMAGTSLRMGLLRLAGPPKTATKEMAKLGLSLSDAQAGAEEAAAVIKSLGIDLSGATSSSEKMTRVLMQLHEKTKGLSQDEKLAAFKGIFGVNAETGWLALFDQGPEVFAKYLNGLRTADGYSKQVAATMLDDTQGALTILESAWDAFSERIGEALTPAVRAAAQALTPIVTAAAQWIEQHPAVVQACAAIAAAMATLIVTAAAVKLAFAGWTFIVTSIQLVQAALVSLGSGAMLGGLIGRLAAVRAALFGLGGAATLGGWSVMFTAISAQAMAAVAAIRTFFASLTLGSMASGIASALSSVGTAIAGVARAAFAFAFSPVGAALMALGAAAYFCYQNWDRVSAVLSTITNLISGSLTSAINMIQPALQNLSSAFSNLFGGDLFGGLLNGLGQFVTGALATVATAVAGVLGTLINVGAAILSAVANIISGIVNLITSVINGDISGAFDAMKSIATAAFSAIGDVAKSILDGILSTVKAISDAWDFLGGAKAPSVPHGDALHGGGGGDFGAPTEPAVTTPSMPEIPPIDTSATQAALDAVGDSATAAAANMDGVNQAAQNISQIGEAFANVPAAMQPAQDAATQTATALTQTGTAAANVSTALDTDASNLGTHTSALSSNGAALQANIGALQAFGAACNGAVGGVTALGGAASSAAGSVSGLGAAAQSACAELAAAGANAAASVNSAIASMPSGGKVSANYSGGIYRKGAFLTTFAERAPEAAIPLDGSRRAQDLWRQAGQILGLMPSTQSVTYQSPKIFTQTQPTTYQTLPQIFNRQQSIIGGGDMPKTLQRAQSVIAPKIFTQTQPTYYPIPMMGDAPNQIFQAQDNGGLIGGLIGKIFSSPQSTSATTLNVTINVNISGNADEQTVRRGVESALPAIDDWAQRYGDYMRDERRRSYA